MCVLQVVGSSSYTFLDITDRLEMFIRPNVYGFGGNAQELLGA